MSSRGRAYLAGLAVTVLFCLPLLPEVLGTRRLIFRDAHVTHWPWRRVAMDSLAAGRVPFVNVSSSGGEPFLANPNAVLLYPTLLLEKVFAPAAAFNLHYLLHVLWAFFGARALARRLGLSEGPAFFSAVAFAFSGIMMSYGSAFANSGASASWLPWCAAATLDLVRAKGEGRTLRAGAAAAIGFGLQLLAGEPALSLLTMLFAAFLGTAEIFSTRRDDRLVATAHLLAGGALAGLVAAALASPLLLPLFAVFPLTYRGQHLYSARAFGASPFQAWRMVEWFFPRFDGDPGALGTGAHWQFAFHSEEVVYIWCVTFGVIPLAAILIAAARRDFWTRRTVFLSGGALVSLLFAFGSSLPFFRQLFSFPAMRRLRFPIKFYLLTTLCVALLAGFAAGRLRPEASRAGRRAGVILLAVALLFGAALFTSWEAKAFDRAVMPLLSGFDEPASLLPEIRRSLTGDALFGLLATAVVGLVLFSRRPIRGQCHLLALATLLLAFPWAMPLFVSADERDLARPPALAGALKGPGRIYVPPQIATLSTGRAHPALPPRVVKLARVQVEELVPLTGSPFGVRYVFDPDRDGTYGYYNQLASEALKASTPEQASRVLRAYGARWVLDDKGAVHPSLRPVLGFEVAGRRLLLSEITNPVPELRWAGREYRRSSLSGALDLVRSERFLPETDIVLPGRSDRGPEGPKGRGALRSTRVEADAASADVAAETAGHVIFGRTYFSAWKTRLDGRRVPVLVANARDLAVAVPAGNHHVEFEYDRAPFHRGVILQTAALLAIMLAAAGTGLSHARRLR